MAKDLQDHVRDIVSHAAHEAAKSFDGNSRSKSGGALSGGKGIAAGAGAVALAPLAVKGVGKLVEAAGVNGIATAPSKAVEGLSSTVQDKLSAGVGDKISEKVEEVGGPGGALKEAVKSALPLGGGGGKGDQLGAGKGRRMPVQQEVDIGLPVETVYNQWTQFEDWPNFMHRVTRVTQEDDCTISFAAKIWGRTKEFTAHIETQRPDERIKWRVTEGMTHVGVVSFHALGPRLTRVLLGLDVEPGGLLEKAARGMRHIKRAARGDLHRFKALIEMQEQETGGWRGVIENGELIQEHDPAYDKRREYAELGDTFPEGKPGAKPSGRQKRSTRQSPPRRSSQGRGSGGRTSRSSSQSRASATHSGRQRNSRSRGRS